MCYRLSFFRPTNSILKKYLLLIFFIIGGVSFIVYTLQENPDYSLFDRLESSVKNGSTGERDILNRYAWNIFSDYPVIGVGSLGFSDEMMCRYHESRTVHNMYMYILAASGILGACSFFLFLLSIASNVLRIVKKNSLPLIILGFILFLAYKTGGILTYLLMWYLFSVIISFINIEVCGK